MIPDPVEGGATFNGNDPQPKGWPTQEHEMICPSCGLLTCWCESELGDDIYTWFRSYGIFVPYRTAYRLAAHITERCQ